MNKFWVLLLFSLPFYGLQAQERRSIDADRPSQGNASNTVLQGTFQLETGFYWQHDENKVLDEDEYHFAETSVRVGILKFAELRLRGQFSRLQKYFHGPEQPGVRSKNSGLDDLMMGTKVQFLKNQGIRPEAAFQADFRFPVGSADFKGSKTEPKLRLNLKNKLTEKISLQYSFGLEWEENETPGSSQDYDHIGLYTLALQYKISQTLAVFAEAYGQKNEATFEQGFDAGLAWSLLPNLQLDAYGGLGLNEAAPDFFVSTGLSFRLPK